MIDEIERVSGSMLVPWVGTMLHYGKALLAAPDNAEQFFLRAISFLALPKAEQPLGHERSIPGDRAVVSDGRVGRMHRSIRG